MTSLEPSAAALRARERRRWLKAIQDPEIRALLEAGSRAHAEFLARARDAERLIRVQATIRRKLARIGAMTAPEYRARNLGELADWLSTPDIRELFARCASSPAKRPRRRKALPVPKWVPGALVGFFRAEAARSDEFEAARLVRLIKHAAAA